MTTLPSAGYFNTSITNQEAKDAQDDVLAVIREMAGGSALTEYTISGGSITPAVAIFSVDTELDAATDELDTIAQTNHPDGRLLILRAADPGRAVTVTHGAGGAGQVLLADGADLELADPSQWLILRRDGTTWVEIGRFYGSQKAAARAFLGLGSADEPTFADVKVEQSDPDSPGFVAEQLTSGGMGELRARTDGVVQVGSVSNSDVEFVRNNSTVGAIISGALRWLAALRSRHAGTGTEGEIVADSDGLVRIGSVSNSHVWLKRNNVDKGKIEEDRLEWLDRVHVLRLANGVKAVVEADDAGYAYLGSRSGHHVKFLRNGSVVATMSDATFTWHPSGGIDADAMRVGGQDVLVEGTTSFVGQAELKDASGVVSVNGFGDLTLPGGQYGYYPEVRAPDGGSQEVAAVIAGHSTGGNDFMASTTDTVGVGISGFRANIRLGEASPGSGDVEARQRYVTASPPWDMGDGAVLGFTFVLLRSGQPIAAYIAEDPPWGYNGPTDIRPERIVAGRKYRRRRRRAEAMARVARGELGVGALRGDDRRSRRPDRARWQGDDDWVEITDAVKNRDMPVVPHPFASARPDDVVVLLDPMDEVVLAMLESVEAGEEGPRLVYRGLIRPDNEPLKRYGPSGVMQVKIRS